MKARGRVGEYTVQLEVAGPLALFARPDTGGTPSSYPVPTFSAAKGILESIAFFVDGTAWICPTRVEVCRPTGTRGGRIQYQRYTTNYGGPLRKKILSSRASASGGSSMQLFATALSDVCYRIYGTVLGVHRPGQVNARHHLKDLFDRRVRRGECFRVPRLGWSECVCTYWGPLRLGATEVDDLLSIELPSMLIGVWSRPNHGSYRPGFSQDLKLQAGVLDYPVPAQWVDRDNVLSQGDAE